MDETKTEVATFGGGCFWCVEAGFQALKGVETVISGYAGGRRPDPNYEQVSTGATGHAEVVQITFDPGIISFRELLEVFFTIHDPTSKDRQGADAGTQYRSIILYGSPEQKETAEGVINEFEMAKIWPGPIVTEVVPLTNFYAAEGYHQNYYQNNPARPYCQAVIEPKLARLHQRFAQKLTL
ncbi:MAG: peptide-methionine (S)-S-oxide reductase MsrA [Opitutales bacterium]